MADGTSFIERAAETYASGARAAEDDILILETIAGKIAGFVGELQPLLDKLDVARDVPGYQGVVRATRRSRLDTAEVAVAIAELFGDLRVINGEAAGLLADQTREAA